MKKVWEFMNSNFFLFLLGFGMTTVLGTFIAERIQQESWLKQLELEKQRQSEEWKREKQFEILTRKLDDGQNTLEEISDLINLRFYRLQNIFVNISQNDLASANSNWGKYFETVEEWNVKLIIYQNKIRRLVNNEEATRFNNFETDDPNLVFPTSIHGKFVVAHQKVLDLLKCLRNSQCTISAEEKREVRELLSNLDIISDNFVERISNIYLSQTIELEEMK